MKDFRTCLISILACLGGALVSLQAQACSCLPRATTLEEQMALERSENAKVLLIEATVLDYQGKGLGENPKPLEMKVRVDAVREGELDAREIVIRGDDGRSCSPYVTQFPKGTQWRFLLRKGQENEILPLSICGPHWKQLPTDQ